MGHALLLTLSSLKLPGSRDVKPQIITQSSAFARLSNIDRHRLQLHTPNTDSHDQNKQRGIQTERKREGDGILYLFKDFLKHVSFFYATMLSFKAQLFTNWLVNI